MESRLETIGRAEMLRRRAASHALGRPPADLGGPAGAVDRLFALQGQDLPGALWSLGLRSGASLPDVMAAFDAGTLVRSWPFRGTLHVLRSADVHWILALTAERTLRSAARRREELELDPGTLERARKITERALAGGGRLGRRDLLLLFESAGISTAGQRGYHLLWHLSVSGTTVLGPMEGKEQLFVLLDDWVARRRDLSGPDALGELVRRYLTGRSPAAAADIAWWSKLPLTSIRSGIAEVSGELEEVEYCGTVHWQLRTGTPAAAGRERSRRETAVLLPGFDEYLLGYQDRSAALEPEHAPLTVPGNNGVFKPTLVLRGRVAGLWSRKASSAGTVLTVQPFSPVSDRDWNAVGRAAARYGQYLGTPVTVQRHPAAARPGHPGAAPAP